MATKNYKITDLRSSSSSLILQILIFWHSWPWKYDIMSEDHPFVYLDSFWIVIMAHFQNGCRKLKEILIFTKRSNHLAPIHFIWQSLWLIQNITSEGHYLMYFDIFKNVRIFWVSCFTKRTPKITKFCLGLIKSISHTSHYYILPQLAMKAWYYVRRTLFCEFW